MAGHRRRNQRLLVAAVWVIASESRRPFATISGRRSPIVRLERGRSVEMNEWRKLGYRKRPANVRVWVFAVENRLVEAAIGRREALRPKAFCAVTNSARAVSPVKRRQSDHAADR
jgi:hypothetical protein